MGCSTLLTYNLHWLLAGRAYLSSRHDHKYQWYARYYAIGWIVFGLGLVGEFWSLFSLEWREWLFFAHLGLIALLYNLPEHKTPGWLISIRRVPNLKIFLIVYLWTVLGAGYPALLLNVIAMEVVWWFVAIFAFVLAITLPFDVRDITEDKEKGMVTLPGQLGLAKTRQLAWGCLLIFGSCGLLAHAPGLGIGVLFFGGAMGVLLTHPKRCELFFTGYLDGLLVLFAPVLLLG